MSFPFSLKQYKLDTDLSLYMKPCSGVCQEHVEERAVSWSQNWASIHTHSRRLQRRKLRSCIEFRVLRLHLGITAPEVVQQEPGRSGINLDSSGTLYCSDWDTFIMASIMESLLGRAAFPPWKSVCKDVTHIPLDCAEGWIAASGKNRTCLNRCAPAEIPFPPAHLWDPCSPLHSTCSLPHHAV